MSERSSNQGTCPHCPTDDQPIYFEHDCPAERARRVKAQHEETGRMWEGPRDQIPKGYSESLTSKTVLDLSQLRASIAAAKFPPGSRERQLLEDVVQMCRESEIIRNLLGEARGYLEGLDIADRIDIALGQDGPGEEDGPWSEGWAERSGQAVPPSVSHEEIAFRFVRELQKRFGKSCTLDDIEIAQEQGWKHDCEKAADAARAAVTKEESR